MSKTILPVNTSHVVIVNNGTARTFSYNSDGTFTVPNNITIGNTTNTYKVILNAANITTTDKTFTFSNRSGTIALEDLTSLLAMLPSTSGNSGKVLSNDGGTTLSWISAGTTSLTSFNGISTATYSAQTFGAVGTSGTAPAWTSINNNTNTHTLNIPMASAAGVTAGLISKTDYDKIGFKDGTNTWSAAQTFSNAPTITTPGTSSNSVATYQQVLDARNGVGIRPPVAIVDDTNYTTALPTALTHAGQSYTYAIGDRVLYTNLTGSLASYNNKVYKVAGISGTVTWVGGGSTPTAETDGLLGTGVPADGDQLFVKSGSSGDCTYAFNGTSWVLYNRAAAYTFSTGLNLTGTTVTVVYGSTGTTACVGNDSRLSDNRTPTAHQLDSATYHTISGKTTGQVLIATSATTFGFVTFSGDVSTISAAGAVTINKIGGVGVNDLGIQQNSATLADNTSAATLVTGCSWAIATYRTIKIEYSISRGSGNYVTGYIVLLHDGTTPRMTYIEDDSIGTHGITFSTDINGGNIRLLYTTTSTGTAATMRFINYTFAV